MGRGTFTNDVYMAYASTVTRNVDGTAKPIHQVFTRTTINESLDPKNVILRESCDSEDSPESLPIIIGLDTTGSMGMIAHSMVSTQLGELMEGIIDDPSIKYPHLMFMAIGDVACDQAPLQASQFEADIRIAQQLTDLYVEGGGGGNNYESYNLPWYFAATKTKIDSFIKRNKKGYIFTIGDELPPPGLTTNDLQRVFGNQVQPANYSSAELVEMASEQYHVFHVVVEQGNYARRSLPLVLSAWDELLGKRVIRLNDYTKLANVIVSVIRVSEGESPEDVINSIQGSHEQSVVRHALGI